MTEPKPKPERKGGRLLQSSGSDYVCANCGLPVRLWYYGWKHSTGYGSGKTCGGKPEPVLRRKGNL